ncbi:uncharacterized protein [Watersipora subatra]|uniref:uncharacterized protein isoform X2 n=1 Tax=Watersipora subatra TaxID=2589382 RepID=UPI00355B0293
MNNLGSAQVINNNLVLQNEYLLSRGRRQATTASWLAWNNWYDNWSDWLDWSNWNAWNTMNSWSGVNSWTSWDGWSSWDGWTSWDDWNAWSDWNSWTSWNTWDTWSSWGSSNNEAASLTAGGIIGIIIAIVVIFILIGICCCCCARKNASPTTTTAINLSTPTAVQYTSAQGTVSNVAPYPGPNSAHLGTAYPTDGASAYPASQAMPTAYWSPNAANNGFVPQPSAPSAPSGSAMGLSAPPPSYHLAVSSDCYSLPTGDVPHKTVSDAPQMSASVQQAAAASSSLEEGMELPTYNEYLQASSENLQASSKNLQASSESLQTSRENLLTPAENWQAPEHNSSSELPHEDHPDL